MSLVRALHGRAAMAGVGAPREVMWELTGEGRKGVGEGGEGGTARRAAGGGHHRKGLWALGPLLAAPCSCFVVYVRKMNYKREKKNEREKEIKGKRKEKLLNLEILREKNK
jgi:hypothetical protein